MNIFKKTIVLFTLSILFACTGAKKSSQASSNSDGSKVFNIGNGAEPSTIDPSVATGVPESRIITALFEGLVSFDPENLKTKPGMAVSWATSDDLKTYTFQMRENAQWSDGTPFTAKDMEYSWKRILSPKLGSEYSYMLFVIENAEEYNKGEVKDWSQVGAKAIDAKTFQVQLKAPTPYFLTLLYHSSTWPVPQHIVEKHGKIDSLNNPWVRPENIVSNGPYTLKNWELNKLITVKKNPLYWNAKQSKIDVINFYPVESLQTEERMFRSGEIHKTNTIPAHKIETYQSKNSNSLHLKPYLGTYFYRFNVTRPPMNNPKVRQALSLAINRELITKKVTRGGEIPAWTFVPPNTAGYTSQTKLSENIEKAKALLAEAGFQDGKGLPTIELLYNTQDTHKAIAVALQQMWKTNIGVNVTLRNQDWKVYLDSQKNLDFDLSRAGWIGDYTDPNTFLDMFVSGGGQNQTGWSNKKYDALISKASITADPKARYELFQSAEKILLTELPILPIYTYTSKYLISDKIIGWKSNILDWNLYQYLDIKE